MTGDSYAIDIGIYRSGRSLIVVPGFEVKGIDMTHASFHVEVNELLGRIRGQWKSTFASSGSKAIACGNSKEASSSEFEKTAAIIICLYHWMKINWRELRRAQTKSSMVSSP